ncbi:hypothetical protein BG011_002546 [Mortierella polycephala]|uniref:Glycosyltransferase family 34 protein n=1 Tax=Mortierella polycephala TaxID=41804 RepID=A0A9P6Q520_9FUNG|nr:hypothetical protein BG011_002546 [Mortierella polycephala]
MAIPARKLYWITAAVFLLIVFLSYHKSNISPYYSNTDNQPDTNSSNQESHKGNTDNNDGQTPNTGLDEGNKPGPTTKTPPPTTMTTVEPNASGKYDTLVIIPSSWTQMQNRRWVRETVFGIKNNLEPCKTHNGNIIYKFYIHGRTTWDKFGIHSAQFMQAQVRDLYGEFMEFDDYQFTNKTTNPRQAVWGEALDWAVNTFIPEKKITVDKVLIFDSTAVVNLPQMEENAKIAANVNGFIYTWGPSATSSFAAMVSFPVLEQILKDSTAIMEKNQELDLISGATFYYADTTSAFKIVQGQGELWASDIGEVQTASAVVGQVHQLEDWMPIAEKMAVKPTPACAVDQGRETNIALLTSSYIYVDMCMAEASLPSAENKRTYASKHGYDFVARGAEFAQEEFRGRRLVWGKIGAIQKVLPHYEWLLWMDMDAVIADMEKDVRDIIKIAEEQGAQQGAEISLIVARPQRDKMLNAGVMLIKNTAWTRRFLNEVQTKVGWYRKSSYEQAAIWEVMTDEKWSSSVYLFDRDDHTMNTFPQYYQNGDFIIHFAPAGCPSVQVLEALSKLKNGESAYGVGVDKPDLRPSDKVPNPV